MNAPAPEPVYGAAPERTAMAWRRTAMSVTICCFLVFHTAVRLGALAVGLAAVGLGVLTAAVSVFAFPAHRYQRTGRPASSWTLLLTVVLAAITLALLGTAAALLALLS